jgi:hypothetical protein
MHRDAVVDRTIADQDIPRDRWSIIGTHRYTTASDWLTFSDFAAYRDDLFTRELIERFDLSSASESNIRRSRFGESNFGVFKSWSDTFFKTEMNLYQDFIQPDKNTLQRTPQVSFWGRRFLANFAAGVSLACRGGELRAPGRRRRLAAGFAARAPPAVSTGVTLGRLFGCSAARDRLSPLFAG